MDEIRQKCSADQIKTARDKLACFLHASNRDTVFIHPIDHPAIDNTFCPCNQSFFRALKFYLKAGILKFIFYQPYNSIKVWFLRRCGASIGKNVYFSDGVWIDPNHTHLLTIEDDVLLGLKAHLFFHEYRLNEYRAGRITIRKGSLVGGLSVIGPGVEIGESATVSAMAAVCRDVPSGMIAVGNPAVNIPGAGRKSSIVSEGLPIC